MRTFRNLFIFVCWLLAARRGHAAATFVREDSRWTITNSTTTYTIQFSNAVPAGSTIVLLYGVEGGNGPDYSFPSNAVPAFDTRSNVYTLGGSFLYSSVHQGDMAYAYVATNILAGDALTLCWTNLTGAQRKSAGAILVFSGLQNAAPETSSTNSFYGSNVKLAFTNTFPGDAIVGLIWEDQVVSQYITNGVWSQSGAAQLYAHGGTDGLANSFLYYFPGAPGSNNPAGTLVVPGTATPVNDSIAGIFLCFKPVGASYFVDFAAGSDSNDGLTTATAFKHCPGSSFGYGDANATATASTTALPAGTTVYFKGGSTYVGEVVLSGLDTVTLDGNSSGMWGSGKALVDEGTNIYHFAAAEHLVGPANNITINNFDVKGLKNVFNELYPANYVQGSADMAGTTNLIQFLGNGGAYSLGGVFVYGSNWTVANCDFHESENWWYRSTATGNTSNSIACQQVGVEIYGGTNVTVTGCRFWAIGSDCVFAGNQSYNVNIVSNNMGGPSSLALTNRGWFAVALECGNGFTNWTFAYNTVHDGWQREGDDANQRDHAGDWVHVFGKTTDVPPNVTNDVFGGWIHHNWFYNDQNFNYANGSADTQIEEGVVGVTLYANVYVNPHHFCLRLNDAITTNIAVLNNTFVCYPSASGGAPLPVYTDATNVNSLLLTNNLLVTLVNNSAALPLTENFLATGGGYTVASDYNDFANKFTLASGSVRLVGSDRSLVTWTSTTGNDAHSLTNQAPLFISLPVDGSTSSSGNYGLTNGSPAIGAGINLAGQGVLTDFGTILWAGVYDLGANKYTGTGGGGGGGGTGATLCCH